MEQYGNLMASLLRLSKYQALPEERFGGDLAVALA
jgi:hypothetical protein